MMVADAIGRRVFRNTASNLAGTAVSLAVGFFLMPFTVRRLGVAGYGIWVLVNSLVSYTGLLGLGLSPTLAKKSAEYLARRDSENLSHAASTLLAILTLIGILAGGALFASSFYLPRLFHMAPAEAVTFASALRIAGLQAALGFPMSIWSGLLAGLQDFHVNNSISIVNSLLTAAGTVFLLSTGYGLIALIWLGMALGIASCLATVWWVKKRIPGLLLRPSLFDSKELSSLVRFGGVMFLYEFAGKVLSESDRIIVGLFLPVASVTVYTVGARLHSYSKFFFGNFLSAVFPASSELSARGETELLRQLYQKGTRYTLAAYGGIAAGLLIFGRDFIALWMGKGFDTSVLVLYILVLGSLYQAQNVTSHMILAGMGKLKLLTRIMVICPILNVSLSFALVLHWGLIGVAWAFTLTLLTLETIVLYYVLDVFHVSFFHLLRECHMKTALALAAPCVIILMLRPALNLRSWPGLFEGVGAYLILYAFSFWFIVISQADKTVLKIWLRNWLAGK